MSVTDISLEPFFNQGGVGGKPGSVPIDTAGVVSNRAAITVTAVAQEITIGAGLRSIEIQNTGTDLIYMGGSGVTDATGIKLFQNQGKLFMNVKDTFSIYFICAAGKTSTLRVIEYA